MLSPNIGLPLVLLGSVLGYYFYFKNMLFGMTRPNLVSWFIWMLAPFLGVFFSLKAGAGFSALPVFIAGFGPFLVLILSLCRRNGYWKLTAFDVYCGIFSFLALIIYIFTRNLSVSILFVILSDGLAAVPTIKKSWYFPKSETSILYLSGIFNQIVGLLTITSWTFSIYSLNIYFIAINTIIIFSIYHKKFLRTEITS